jgi:hypothetical protein
MSTNTSVTAPGIAFIVPRRSPPSRDRITEFVKTRV